MNPELAGRVYDELIPGWREARLVSGNREVRAPYREDRHPSLHIDEEKLVWIDRALDEGGGAWDLAIRMLGEDDAKKLLKRLDPNDEAPKHELEILGDPTSAQIAALKRSRRLKNDDTLRRVGAKLVRARFRRDEASPWGPREEWLGFPTISPDSWKLWALNRNGVVRLDAGKLIRRNAGPVSLILSPALREAAPGSVPVLLDVEGESDFIAAIEAGFAFAIASTGGAGALSAHVANAGWLRGLLITEVIAWGDRDEAGRRGAQKRAEWWRELGVAVRVPALPEALGPGGDLRDYLNGGVARDGSYAVEPFGDATALGALARAAPLREPEPRPLELDQADEDQEADELEAFELPRSALRGSFLDFIDYLRPITAASPAHAFASWWAVSNACIGRARWGTWNGRVVPVVYTLACGSTGDHKTTAMDAAIALLPDLVRCVSGVTSDAGLFDALEGGDDGPRPVLLHFDELAFLLKMAAMNGSTLNPVLNRLWSAPEHLDRNLSKRNPNGGARRVERPFACLIGGTQPETFWRTIGDPDLAVASGFVNRLAVFAAKPGQSLPRTAAPDERAATALRQHLAELTRLAPGCVSLARGAEALWDEFAQDHDRRIRTLPGLFASVGKRVRDHVARLALVYATDGCRLQVSAADLTAAIEVGAYLEGSYRSLLDGRQADRGPARTADLETIARKLLVKRPGVWRTARDFIHGWPNSSRPSSRELRGVLQAMDGVEIKPASGSHKEAYRVPARRKGTIHHTPPNPSKSKADNGVWCVGGPPRAE
jgi:hypothetical protein